MTYCSTDELAALTGSTLGATTILTPIIEQADREINAYLAMANVSGGDANALKSASLHLSIAGLFTRYRLDGTKPASLTIGPMTTVDNVDQAIAVHRAEAKRILDSIISTAARAGTVRYVRRVNG